MVFNKSSIVSQSIQSEVADYEIDPKIMHDKF